MAGNTASRGDVFAACVHHPSGNTTRRFMRRHCSRNRGVLVGAGGYMGDVSKKEEGREEEVKEKRDDRELRERRKRR